MSESRDWCTASPDRLPHVGWIAPCCKAHDEEYDKAHLYEKRSRTSKRARKAADKRLRDCIRQTAAARGEKARGIIYGEIYYRAVRMFGYSLWFKSQSKGGPT